MAVASDTPDPAAAERALALLGEMSAEMRGGAILAADGRLLAATGEADAWGPASLALLEAADQAGGERVEQVHIGTEEGEVFALRHDGLAAVAVTERFALASLVSFDMRAVLRDLAGKR